MSKKQNLQPVIKGAPYFISHVPSMVRSGSKPSREIQYDSSLLPQILDHLQDFDQAVAYPPNQVFIGNMDPDELWDISPCFQNPVPNASRWGDFGEIMPEEEFYGMLKICDEYHLLAKIAASVTLIHRRDQLRASGIMREKVLSDPKIEILWSSVVNEILGGDVVEKIKVRHVVTGEQTIRDISGFFVSAGVTPNTGFVDGVVSLDDSGHINIKENMETNVPGVFAAGDVRHNSVRQVSTAAGDGVTAVINAEKYLVEFT